jgi:hypothetical protein
MNWVSVKDILPNKREYILIKTECCKYPAIVGYYDGVNFKTACCKSLVVNAEYWVKI